MNSQDNQGTPLGERVLWTLALIAHSFTSNNVRKTGKSISD